MTEELIPIDIQCNKLVDWLIDRRHCSIKWQKAATVVKQKISAALLDMPSTPEMKQLLEGSCFHYFKCLKIVEVLKDTEKSSKNIFGMYSSQRMKDWKEIVKLYEKDNLHLAELSNRLLRNVTYELPAVKRQIARCTQVEEDCQKKIEECKRSVRTIERAYTDECMKVGIVGKNVRKELMELVAGLPAEFDAIGLKCKDLLSVIEYYGAFVEFSISSDEYTSSVSPMLRHVCAHGNTSVYHWKHGEVPDKVIKEDLGKASTEVAETKEEEIDWGEPVTDVPTADDVIDFDIDVGDAGIVLETSGDDENQNNEIEFEMVEEKGSENWQIEEVSITEIPNGSKMVKKEKVATGEEALSLLESVPARAQFLNELSELKGFLFQRLTESRKESDVLSMNQFQLAPPILQLTSTTELETMLAQVSSIYDDLTTNKMSQLCRILDSPKYVDRMADNLSRLLQSTKKYDKLRSSYENTIQSNMKEEVSLRPKVDFLKKETKEWQKLIEEEISKRYKNRPVYLMGSINML